MDGKPHKANTVWTNEQDQFLLDNIQLSNDSLAQSLGRTSTAILCRRSHLAAKMHQARAGSPLPSPALRVTDLEWADAS